MPKLKTFEGELQEDPIAHIEIEQSGIEISDLGQNPNITKKERILIVSNYSQFASTDVWGGLCRSFMEAGYVVMPYAIHKIRAFLSHDFMLKDIVATAVSTRNNFTHVLFIGSAFVPSWVVRTIQKSRVVVMYWSLEDPHALDQNGKYYELADIYFTNERRVKDLFPKAIYMPTAGDANECMPPRAPITEIPKEYREIFDNDIVFCGNIYPNRQKVLETLVPLVEEQKYKFGIIGITALMENRETSPLLKYVIQFSDERGKLEGVVDHRFLVMAYGYAKIAINLERDSSYEYDSRFSTNRVHKLTGESLNPRAYEIALCGGSLQLIDNKRAEALDGTTFEPGKHIVVYTDAEDLKQKVRYYMEHEEERMAIVQAARAHALKFHTYGSRCARFEKAIHLQAKDGPGLLRDFQQATSAKK